MCTAILLNSYVGRNLDIERRYGESVIITPRKYTISFRRTENISDHPAFIGIGVVSRGYPLYYDAANEHGLYIAGLNYVSNAKYHVPKVDRINLTPYELIPYLLSKCKSVKEARIELSKINLINIPFSKDLSCAELHFFIADKNESITVEPNDEGIKVYDNQIGVLTNNPPFPLQLHNLNNYAGLTNKPLVNHYPKGIPFNEYSRGMGALGLPGDLSSESRFVRAAFHKINHVGTGNVTDIFHLLSSVAMPNGSLDLGNSSYERTEYTSAVNLNTLTYYYRTYKSSALCSASLYNKNSDSPLLISYPLISVSDIQSHN